MLFATVMASSLVACSASFDASITVGGEGHHASNGSNGSGGVIGNGTAPTNDAGPSPSSDPGPSAVAPVAPSDPSDPNDPPKPAPSPSTDPIPVPTDAPGAVMCRYAVPDTSTETMLAGQADAQLLVGTHDAKVTHLTQAALVPVPGTDQVQVVLSDDPALCEHLTKLHQTASCSIDGSDTSATSALPGYSYVTASLSAAAPASSSVNHLALTKGGSAPLDLVQWDGVLRVDGALSSTSTSVSGRYYACDGVHGLTSSGVFVASYCGTALPVCG